MKKADQTTKTEIESCFNQMNFEPQKSWPALIDDSDRELLGEIIEFDENVNPGFKFYHVRPQKGPGNNNKVIIVIHDIGGFLGSRSLSLCDQLAIDTNAHIIMPDFYRNNDNIDNHGGFDPTTGLGPQQINWISKFDPESVIKDYEFTIDYLLNNNYIGNAERISTLGFCWGGYVSMVLSNDKLNSKYPLKSAGSCHPSPIVITFFNQTVTNLFENIDKPQYIAAAGFGDGPEIKNGGELAGILASKKIGYEFIEFPEMIHGWVPRGDLGDLAVKRDVKGAIEGAVEFYDRYL